MKKKLWVDKSWKSVKKLWSKVCCVEKNLYICEKKLVHCNVLHIRMHEFKRTKDLFGGRRRLGP